LLGFLLLSAAEFSSVRSPYRSPYRPYELVLSATPLDSLRRLASDLDVPERTLRRAASEGLIRGQRISPRRFRTTLREELYLRSHWGLLRELRSALRTEPNVRLAVLFGSTSTGADHAGSDVDLLVVLSDPSVSRLADLADRLCRRSGREIQVVRLQDAERSPALMTDALEQGRVLVDRDHRWPQLAATPRRRRRSGLNHRSNESMQDS
jgi:predicted nucleotidyltransferase